MAVLRQKAKAKKAELEANAAAAEARRAAQDSIAAARDLAQALAAQLEQLGVDERAREAVERVRSSEAYGKAQARAAEAVERAQAKADELGKRMADSDAVAVGREATSRQTGAALAGLGTWLATGDRGKRLGIATRRRSTAGWLFALLGIGIGYGIGILTAPKQGREIREQMIARRTGDDTLPPHAGDRQLDGAPSFERPLADKVRTRLGEDPRTADLPSLNLNVIDGTVVVRGTLPDDADVDAVREVIASVDGVDAVDMRLDATA